MAQSMKLKVISDITRKRKRDGTPLSCFIGVSSLNEIVNVSESPDCQMCKAVHRDGFYILNAIGINRKANETFININKDSEVRL